MEKDYAVITSKSYSRIKAMKPKMTRGVVMMGFNVTVEECLVNADERMCSMEMPFISKPCQKMQTESTIGNLTP